MAKLTTKQKAQKALEVAKAKELAKGIKPKFVKPGTSGESLTGKRHWG